MTSSIITYEETPDELQGGLACGIPNFSTKKNKETHFLAGYFSVRKSSAVIT
jgi:hypothetical protein